MKPFVDARDPRLWQDVTPDKIWERWKAGLERNVVDVFRGDRPRPVLEVRADFERPSESGRP